MYLEEKELIYSTSAGGTVRVLITFPSRYTKVDALTPLVRSASVPV